jgi:hypothetical protein
MNEENKRGGRTRANPWWALAIILGLVGGTVGCGHSLQASNGNPSTVLQVALSKKPARGPLRIDSSNSRYFADDLGNLVYLTGSHTWNSLQDWGTGDTPPKFDYGKYLDFLAEHGHNFFRLYVWEQAAWVPWSNERVLFGPLPYLRTGPGAALDGYPRFDLRQWNPQYFERLRQRVQQAGDRGIYVSVMLFNGWSVDGKRSAMTTGLRQRGLGDPWRGHPFNRDNNINSIDGRAWGKVHTLQDPAITELQKAYARKVIETVGDLDNVLWEISNESNPESTAWEYQMIGFIHATEAKRHKQHPVGMTAEFPNGNNAVLWQSPADWVSPGSLNGAEGYASDPPPAAGGKVIVTDTDHIWGIGGSSDWVWKSFARGLNPIFMDPYDADLLEIYPMYNPLTATNYDRAAREKDWESIRKNLGFTHAYSMRMNLAAMTPHGELASSGYCIANPGLEYLAYIPARQGWRGRLLRELPSSWFVESVEVDLSRAPADLQFEWFSPASGTAVGSGNVKGGGRQMFAAPIRGNGMALYIHAK